MFFAKPFTNPTTRHPRDDRAWFRALLALTFGLALAAGCSDNSAGDDDDASATDTGGIDQPTPDQPGTPVTVNEAALRGTLNGQDVALSVPLKLVKAGRSKGTLTVSLVQLAQGAANNGGGGAGGGGDFGGGGPIAEAATVTGPADTVISTRSVAFDIVADSDLALAFTLPEVTQSLGDAARYVVSYQVRTTQTASAGTPTPGYGRRSLFDVLDKTETIALGPTSYLAGSQTFLRLIVTDPKTRKPVAGAAVKAELVRGDKVTTLWTGQTDATGFATPSLSFPIDATGQATLRLTMTREGSTDVVEQPVTVVRDSRILITTDKPLYQPGQTMHLRALALAKPSLKPAAGEKLTLEVLDGKANKVFRKEVTLNDFGAAGADFKLATLVNTGTYTIRATLADTKTEKTVTVDRYVLPKFKVSASYDRAYYKPGDTVTGTISAQYFFGKPVAGGSIDIKASRYDIGLTEFASLTGKTNSEGLFDFSTKLPGFFAGQPLEQGSASAFFDITVTDGAGQKFNISSAVPVAAGDLVPVVFAEQPAIVEGLENRLFVAVSDPTGAAVAGAGYKLFVNSALIGEGTTDSYGVADFRFVPTSGSFTAEVQVTAAGGKSATRSFDFTGDAAGTEAILARTDKGLYRVGEKLNVKVLASGGRSGRVFVDVIREGQTVNMQAVDLKGGVAEAVFDLSADYTGALTIFAYQIGESGRFARSSRLVYVAAANDLAVTATLDKATYKPAEPAKIDFTVKDLSGTGVPAALGVYIVDEAVYALTDNRPGLEKVYFQLTNELLTPRAQVQGFSATELLAGDDQGGDTARRDRAGDVLTAAASRDTSYTLNVDTFAAAQSRATVLLTSRVGADLNALMGLLASQYSAGLFNQATVASWVKANYAGIFPDPFGSLYELSVDAGASTLTLTSYGPDEAKGTADDVKSQSQLWQIYYGANGGVAEGGDFGGQPGAGGGGDAGGGMDGAAGDDDDNASPDEDDDASGGEGGGDGPRVRKFFPETLYANPLLITDDAGKATVNLTMADSITTWRMSATASSKAGALGSMAKGITVFQDFFVDLDLPVALTRGDSFEVPVAVFNYLPTTESVSLTLDTTQTWFTLNDAATKSVTIAPNTVGSVTFKITARDVGIHGFTVTAQGSNFGDAVLRTVRVTPNGDPVVQNSSGMLKGTVSQTLSFPAEALTGATEAKLTIFPGLAATAIGGLDSILQMPSGCFEQTSSSTYPNVLVLDYLRATNSINPEIEAKAIGYIAEGYQKLLTFEVAGGGFEWFGNDPAHTILTAYGLLEFSDMAKVYDVDPAVIARTRSFLAGRQSANGSWTPTEGGIAEGAINNFQSSALRNTAFVTWALLESGAADSATNAGLAFLRANRGSNESDSYTLAVMANAFLAGSANDPDGLALLDTLDARKLVDGDKVHWSISEPTETYSSGDGSTLETTSLITFAMIKAGAHLDTAQGAINYLAGSKDKFGNWETTQGTIYALKALLASVALESGERKGGTVAIKVDDKLIQTLNITPDQSDVLQLVDLSGDVATGDNVVTLTMTGDAKFLYQLTGTHFIEWQATETPKPAPTLAIDVSYDKTQLDVSESANATVTVTNNALLDAMMVLLDIGIPPGFGVQTDDLEPFIGTAISKYEVTPQRLIVYLYKVPGNGKVTFSYRVQATTPLRSTAPRSAAYPYYTPDARAESQPVVLTVTAAN
jgi:alpha-2-macroglobulin-like protein